VHRFAASSQLNQRGFIATPPISASLPRLRAAPPGPFHAQASFDDRSDQTELHLERPDGRAQRSLLRL